MGGCFSDCESDIDPGTSLQPEQPLGSFSAFSIRICGRLSSQSPHAPVPSMKVAREPNLSAKSSPVTGSSAAYPSGNVLRGPLSSGFQGAHGGDHLLQHFCDLRNMGLTAGTGSPQAWGHGKKGSQEVCGEDQGLGLFLWDPQHQAHLASPYWCPWSSPKLKGKMSKGN